MIYIVKVNVVRRKTTVRKIEPVSPALELKVSESPASVRSGKVETYLLRVHLYSTIEVKQTTVLKVPSTTKLTDVFEQICEKRKYIMSDYLLKMPDTLTDVPMDKTLEELGCKEFCILKRDRGGGILWSFVLIIPHFQPETSFYDRPTRSIQKTTCLVSSPQTSFPSTRYVQIPRIF